MDTIVYVGGMVILWVLNLVKGTGLGQAYNILEITKMCCIVLAAICLMIKARQKNGLLIERRLFLVVLLMMVIFIAVSWFNNRNFAATEYLWAYFIVFILSMTRPTERIFRFISLAYGLMGLVVLGAYTYTDILKGWDGNSVAMVGLSSFLIFLIPYYENSNLRSKFILILAGVVFGVLFWNTGSRSCIFAAAIALLVFFGIVSANGILRSDKAQTVVMLIPLAVAGVVAALSTTIDIAALDAWSLENFDKPFFNGRELIWLNGFQRIAEDFWLGSGYINSGHWHNSALACLTAYGVIGYALWISLFKMIIGYGTEYHTDTCTAGCMTAFLVLYVQQSVELGLMAPNPNLLPYAMLGLLLGRVNYLKERDYEG